MRTGAIPALLVLIACSPAGAPVADKTSAATPAEPWTLQAVSPDTTDGLRILVLHDMEGLSGQNDPNTFFFGQPEYKHGQELLAADVNAVIAGLYLGGATEVWVVDAHGSGNPDPDVRADLLDKRAQQVFRDTEFDPYVDLVAPKAYDAVAVVAMHAKTGSHGFASHTYTIGIGLEMNGREITETELVGLSYGRQGIPVIFGSGDNKLAQDLAGMNWIEFVTVKNATAADSAELRPVAEARADLTAHAKTAVENLRAGKTQAMKINLPMTAGVKAVPPASLEMLDGVPGINFKDSTVTFPADSLAQAYAAQLKLIRVATSNYQRYIQRAIMSDPAAAKLVMPKMLGTISTVWFDVESGRWKAPPPPPAPAAGHKYHGDQ